MSSIVLDRVSKRYPNGYLAARELSLEVREGELLVLVGPSGSGKSTVLRMIAGLEAVSSGTISIGGRDVTHLPPQERDLAMVFQSYALYPHMTVRQNLGFGLRMRKTPVVETEQRTAAVAESLGLTPLLDRRPAELSGGQRQRVALGRAIVREPVAFLFDEPLSNLDAKLRVETRAELSRLHRRLAATTVYVTHDQTEAMTLGDRVAVIDGGALQQVAPPLELYRRPANRFVAGFIGNPQMNLFEGVMDRSDSAVCFRSEGLNIALGSAAPPPGTPTAISLGVRPHDLRLASDSEASFPATVTVVEPLGSEQIVHLSTPGGKRFLVVAPPNAAIAVDEAVRVVVAPGGIHLFSAESGERVGQQPAAV